RPTESRRGTYKCLRHVLMLKVGLTGGLASGKSFVGQSLVELGCQLIQADELGHQVLHSSGEAYAAVVREFGNGIVQPDGEIDRAMRRDGMSRDEALARLSRQMPLAEKRKFADYIVDTSGPKSETLKKTRELYESLRRITT